MFGINLKQMQINTDRKFIKTELNNNGALFFEVSDFIIEKMHDEAPPLTHGVLLDMVQNGAAPPSHPDTGASDTPTLAAPTCRKFSLLCGNEFVGSFGPTQHHPPPQQHRYHRFASPSSQPAVDSAVDQRPVYREQ